MRSLFGLVDILERDGLWSDRWLAPVLVSLDCHLARFRGRQEIPGEKNSLWLSGMGFHSGGHHGLPFRLFGFQVEEDNPAQYRKYPYFRSDIGNRESDRIANNTCNNAHHGNYPFSQNGPLFAASQEVRNFFHS